MATRKRNYSKWGTSYFTSKSAAVRYYKAYGDDAASVDRKIKEGSIHVGKPPLKAGQTLSTVDGGKRYAIEENPKATIPRNKWVTAKIRVTSSGKIQAKVPASSLKKKR